MAKKLPQSEDEAPPNSKIRVVATVEEKLLAEMRLIHDKEVTFAREHDRVDPDWSNTVEMLLRKGVKAYNQ